MTDYDHSNSGRDEKETREFQSDDLSVKPSVDPLESVKIGRYNLLRQLGAGGFGSVFLADDPTLKRQVAIKVPRRSLPLQTKSVDKFLREGQMLAQANHPSIVSVYDVGLSQDNIPFVVMEYVEGKSLSQLCKEKRPTQEESLELLIRIGEGLQQAHKRGLVHRDFKPANIIITNEHEICLVDFGLALHDELTPRDWAKSEIVGTPTYMAPEQIRGENHLIDGQTDIWAFGVTMYLLLTGKPPFKNRGSQELSRAICYKNPKPPRQIDETIPKPLERICLRCIRKLMDERYQSMADVLDELNAFIEDSRQAEALQLDSMSNSIAGIQSLSDESQGSRSRRSRSLPSSQASSLQTDTSASRSRIGEQLNLVPKGLKSFDQNDREFFLSLLPGPTDRHGLPQSIRFWMSRLGIHDQVDDVPVSLIYGPSGCGKSSFVRAGLIPCLPENVIPVYVDCTTDDLPSRIISQIHQEIHDIPVDAELIKTMRQIRLGNFLRPNDKLLLVLDQFEQWLNSTNDYAENELTEALRHCESERVQVLLLIRDEFWLNASQFLRGLSSRIEESRNAMSLPLFDEDHARNVLEAIGRAYGTLPGPGSTLSKQQSRFLKEAVKSLQIRGKVICVHLSVFAETAKNRPWNYSELKSMGGWEGIGREFIADIFNDPGTPGYVKQHSGDAWKILEQLLPKSSSELKGNSVEKKSLRSITNLSSALFDELIHYLEFEANLISPVADDELFSDENGSTGSKRTDEDTRYGLTHDFLVKPIRDWGLAKQNETRQGRADCRIKRLANQWQITKDDRFLLSIPDYLDAVVFGSLNQRKQYESYWKATTRRSIRFLSILGVVLLTLVIVGFFILRQNQNSKAMFALEQYLNCQPRDVSGNRISVDSHFHLLESEIRKSASSESAQRSARANALIVANSNSNEVAAARQLLGAMDKIDGSEFENIYHSLVDTSTNVLPEIQHVYGQVTNPELKSRLAITAAYLNEFDLLARQLRLKEQPDARTLTIDQLGQWRGDLTLLAANIYGKCADLDGELLSGICSGFSFLDPAELGSLESAAIGQLATDIYRNSLNGGAHMSAMHLLGKHAIKLPQSEPHRTESNWFTLEIASQLTPNKLHRLLLVRIEPGSFVVGSGLPPGERVRTLEIQSGEITEPYWISSLEISNQLFDEFKHQTSPKLSDALNSSLMNRPFSGMPIGDVSHDDCLEFCRWLNSALESSLAKNQLTPDLMRLGDNITFNLPTLDQFELASRAKAKTSFYFGNGFPLLTRYAGFGIRTDTTRNRFIPNGFGVSDTIANHEEWMREKDEDGFAFCKGGYKNCNSNYLPTAASIKYPASAEFELRGFRVVLEQK